MEPEPKLCNFFGSGSSQKGRLLAAPAPKLWVSENFHFLSGSLDLTFWDMQGKKYQKNQTPIFVVFVPYLNTFQVGLGIRQLQRCCWQFEQIVDYLYLTQNHVLVP